MKNEMLLKIDANSIFQLKATADSMKKVVVGLIIAEYGIREMLDNAKQEFKQRTKIAIKSILSVQNYFLYHPETSPEIKEVFKKYFVRSELYMLSELILTVWGFDDKTLEEIINAIKGNTKEIKNA